MEENGCKDCLKCEDVSNCLQSIRKAVGYMADLLARTIESNKMVNERLIQWLSKSKKSSKDFEAFYS